MYHLNLDENGYLLSVNTVEEPTEGEPCIESLDGLDLSGHRISAYCWDGERLTLDEDRLSQLEAEAAEDANEEQIARLKAYLAATDYVVIKIAEGVASSEVYADIITQRRDWREEINKLEGAV